MMNPETQTPAADIGKLIVNVATAQGAIPLEDATVSVFYDEPDRHGLFTSAVTDTSGKTPRIELPAPARSLSEKPGIGKPFATYHIHVEKEGYYPVENAGIPIFSGVTSIQPVEMIPLAAENSEEVYPRYGLEISENENPNL